MSSRKSRRAKAAKLKADRMILEARRAWKEQTLPSIVDANKATPYTVEDRAWCRVKSSHNKVVENMDRHGPRAFSEARQLAGNRGIVQRPTRGKASECRRVIVTQDTVRVVKSTVAWNRKGTWHPA